MTAPLRVLVVDDDENEYLIIRALVRRAKASLKLEWAQTTELALQRLVEGGYDVALIDYRLDGSTGLELIHTARNLGCPSAMILLTGSDDLRVEREALAAGADDFIGKAELTPRVLNRAMSFALERRRAHAETSHAAMFDPLTQLPNRALLLDRLAQAQERLRRHPNQAFAVLFIDLDKFKPINDELGHAAGDEVLKEIARRLTLTVRASDSVARLGGDEFVVVAQGVSEVDEARLVAEKLRQAVRRPLVVDQASVSVDASIGIRVVTDSSCDGATILAEADEAMYADKRASDTSRTRTLPATGWLKEMKTALVLDEFRAHYQPIVTVDDGSVVAYEALMRWAHPARGIVPPGQFLDLAERSGLIVDMGWKLLERVCGEMHERPSTLAHVHFNLSPRQLLEPGFVPAIAALVENKVKPERLCLELTEIRFADLDRVGHVLDELRGLGFRVALDDFGTADSSLRRLAELHVDEVKIDRSLLMLDSRRHEVILRSTLMALQELGTIGTIEGVETPAQLEFIRSVGIPRCQGYLFGRPEPLWHDIAA